MSSDDLMMGDDLRKFRIITGYGRFDMGKQKFKAKPYHMAFYAKDVNVLNFMIVMSRVPKGQLVEEVDSEFDYCLN